MICIKSDSSPFCGIALSIPHHPSLRALPPSSFERWSISTPFPSGCSRPTRAGKPMDVQDVPPNPLF